MTTLYIDVFFLINFTVDLLAVFFSCRLLSIRTSVPRLIICGVFGSIAAIIDLFVPHYLLIKLANCVACLLFIGMLAAKKISFIRRIKLLAVFFVCECLLGGMVYYAYEVLNKYFSDVLSDVNGDTENRKALIFSVIILVVIGAFKLVIMLFTGERSIRSAEIEIEVEGNKASAEALVDSGNLVCDPMNMCPVIFIKPSLACKILPRNIIELSGLDNLSEGYRKRIRLIPVSRNGSTHVMTGIRVDRVSVKWEQHKEEVDATVAIDKEDGDFGGYEALVPASALENAF